MTLKKGDVVLLKTLDDIVKMSNVSDWTQVKYPTINSTGRMNHLFGDYVEVLDPDYNEYTFKAIGIGEKSYWYFNKKWIESHKKIRIPDELFEL